MVHGSQLWPLSVAAYHALGDLGLLPRQTELLYGQIFHKMSKSPFHSGLVMRLIKLLLPVLPAEYHLRPEQPLTCPDSEPEPDVAVVRGREEDFWQAHPRTAELVIEVCVSSHDFDRFKLRAYASAGVKEVWLVLGPEKQIEVYRQPVGEDFAEHALFSAGQTLVSQVIPEFKIEVAALFAV